MLSNINLDEDEYQDTNIYTKKSLGIILISPDLKKILLVKKRYTYAFDEFIHGRYNKDNYIQMHRLFSSMTMEEKLVIRSLNYDYMWFHKHLSDGKNEHYYKGLMKFSNNFLKKGNDGELIKLIDKTGYTTSTIYEFPKGRKKNKSEPNIITAIREVKEETSISENLYRIIPHMKRTSIDIDSGVRYLCVYYVAIAYNVNACVTRLDKTDQCFEISEAEWYTVDELKKLCNNNKTCEMAISVITCLKRDKMVNGDI